MRSTSLVLTALTGLAVSAFAAPAGAFTPLSSTGVAPAAQSVDPLATVHCRSYKHRSFNHGWGYGCGHGGYHVTIREREGGRVHRRGYEEREGGRVGVHERSSTRTETNVRSHERTETKTGGSSETKTGGSSSETKSGSGGSSRGGTNGSGGNRSSQSGSSGGGSGSGGGGNTEQKSGSKQ